MVQETSSEQPRRDEQLFWRVKGVRSEMEARKEQFRAAWPVAVMHGDRLGFDHSIWSKFRHISLDLDTVHPGGDDRRPEIEPTLTEVDGEPYVQVTVRLLRSRRLWRHASAANEVASGEAKATHKLESYDWRCDVVESIVCHSTAVGLRRREMERGT